jgi:hypothetical protein
MTDTVSVLESQHAIQLLQDAILEQERDDEPEADVAGGSRHRAEADLI